VDHGLGAGHRHHHRSPQPVVPWALCVGVRRPTASAVPLSAGSRRAVHALIKIEISVEAFEAITKTLPVGSVGYEAEANERGERLIVMVRVGLGYIVTDAI
jgi:hypothetical protein